MDWLSLCVCGAKGKQKAKKDGKREANKKSKKSRKRSKRKGSCKASPSCVDESLRKSQDEEQFGKEITEKEWTNGEIVNCRDEPSKNQILAIDGADTGKLSDSLNSTWSCRIEDDCNNVEESREDPARNADESDQETCSVDQRDDAFLSYSNAAAEDAKNEIKHATSEKRHDEDDSASRSAISEEPEDSSWISEDGEKPAAESSFDRRLEERISSRINFSNKEPGTLRKTALPRRKAKNVLPPIKKRPSKARNCNEEPRREQMNKFGFKRDAVFGEQREIRRKLNSCSFEIRPFEKRSGKARIRAEGSMIPRLTSSMRQEINSFKSDKSEIMQNGILLQV